MDTPTLPGPSCGWRDWIVPLHWDGYTLREILDSAAHLKAAQDDIPLIVQLVENPKFDLPWINIFEGAVSLADHDCIHALLGRGMLPKDEAFTIGFTMGSTNRVGAVETRLYSWISKYLYPGPYQFNDEDLQVFKDAVYLGYISDCTPLDQINFEPYMKQPVAVIREQLGLEADLLTAYYRVEKKRYPSCRESQRLLPPG